MEKARPGGLRVNQGMAMEYDLREKAAGDPAMKLPNCRSDDPENVKFRGEKHFQKLMQRLKYDWEHFEV